MLRYECTYCMMFYTCLVNNFLHRVNVRSSIQNMSCYFLAAQNLQGKFISCNDISNNLWHGKNKKILKSPFFTYIKLYSIIHHFIHVIEVHPKSGQGV